MGRAIVSERNRIRVPEFVVVVDPQYAFTNGGRGTQYEVASSTGKYAIHTQSEPHPPPPREAGIREYCKIGNDRWHAGDPPAAYADLSRR